MKHGVLVDAPGCSARNGCRHLADLRLGRGTAQETEVSSGHSGCVSQDAHFLLDGFIL